MFNNGWECLNCGFHNGDSSVCEGCSMDKEAARLIQIVKAKRMCEECGHRHREGFFCHVFLEAAAEGLEESLDVESGSDSSADSSDDADLLGWNPNRKKQTLVVAPSKMKPLTTPGYVRRAGFVRCNCQAGVPPDSRRFEAIPKQVMVDFIQVRTYDEIMFPGDKLKFESDYQARFGVVDQEWARRQRMEQISLHIPRILSFLPLGSCSPIPQVCTYWNYGTNLYLPYIDMRNCVPHTAYRVHQGQVDCLWVSPSVPNRIYSAGDRRVLSSDWLAATVLGTVARDSGSLRCLIEEQSELYCCSSNGSIRSYALTHSGKDCQLLTTMWDHTRSVEAFLLGLPSVGPCVAHGIDKHICLFYSASEDRTIKVWNAMRHKAIRSIQSKALRSASYLRLAQSDRHIFASTTTGSIAVFSKENKCERVDVHPCLIPGTDSSFCLQLFLKLPPIQMLSGALTAVTGLLCVSTGSKNVKLMRDENGKSFILEISPLSADNDNEDNDDDVKLEETENEKETAVVPTEEEKQTGQEKTETETETEKETETEMKKNISTKSKKRKKKNKFLGEGVIHQVPVYTHLWAGDSSGQLTIWEVPETGLDFTPAFTVKAHDGGISDLSQTKVHVVSISDDGFLLLWDLFSFVRVRSIPVHALCVERNLLSRPDVPRKLKSVHALNHGDVHNNDFNNGSGEEGGSAGVLAVGTSYGDIIVFNTGTAI